MDPANYARKSPYGGIEVRNTVGQPFASEYGLSGGFNDEEAHELAEYILKLIGDEPGATADQVAKELSALNEALYREGFSAPERLTLIEAATPSIVDHVLEAHPVA